MSDDPVTQEDVAELERVAVRHLDGMLVRIQEWETKQCRLMRHRNACLVSDIQKETKGKYGSLLRMYTSRNQRAETLEEQCALHEELNDFLTLVQASNHCVC